MITISIILEFVPESTEELKTAVMKCLKVLSKMDTETYDFNLDGFV